MTCSIKCVMLAGQWMGCFGGGASKNSDPVESILEVLMFTPTQMNAESISPVIGLGRVDHETDRRYSLVRLNAVLSSWIPA